MRRGEQESWTGEGGRECGQTEKTGRTTRRESCQPGTVTQYLSLAVFDCACGCTLVGVFFVQVCLILRRSWTAPISGVCLQHAFSLTRLQSRKEEKQTDNQADWEDDKGGDRP